MQQCRLGANQTCREPRALTITVCLGASSKSQSRGMSAAVIHVLKAEGHEEA